MLTPRMTRSASCLCLVGQPTCRILLGPLQVHCWLFFTKPPAAKPVLFAYSCTSLYSNTNVEAFVNTCPKVPSCLPALRHYKYHDYEQSYDLCVRQVCQAVTLWRRAASCTDQSAETADFRRVASLQRSTRNMRCHLTPSS